MGPSPFASIARAAKPRGADHARRPGLARNTVREAVRSAAPPQYERRATDSAVDRIEPDIRRLLAAHPRMPATVIAGRIGWERALTVFLERVRDLRRVYLPPDPARRTTYRPGQLASGSPGEPSGGRARPVGVPVRRGTAYPPF